MSPRIAVISPALRGTDMSVDNRMMLPPDLYAFAARLFLRDSHVRLVPRGSWLAWHRSSAGCTPAGDQGSADGEFAHS